MNLYESLERTHQEGFDVLVVGDDSVVNDDELYKRKTGNVSHRYLHFVRNYTSTLTESRRNFSNVFLDHIQFRRSDCLEPVGFSNPWVGVDPVGFSVGRPVGLGTYHSVGGWYVRKVWVCVDPVGLSVGCPAGVGTYHSVGLILCGWVLTQLGSLWLT